MAAEATRLRLGTVALGARPCIVAAGGEDDVAALANAEGADAIELRADLFAARSEERRVGKECRL